MNSKAQRLTRLLAIRRLSEDLDRRKMDFAVAAVTAVENALGMQQSAQVEAMDASRAALESGERGEWLMSDAQSEVAGWNRRRLRVLLHARAAELAPAMERLLQSRLEHEQMKLLVENAQTSASMDADRKAQAAADDWFLGRRARKER